MTRIPYLVIGVLLMWGCRSSYQHQDVVQQKPLMGDPSTDSTVTVIAGEIYEADEVKRFFLGDHYRDVWTTPIEVPVINLDKAKGGLKILDKGGGMQTKSLKLKGADGRLYSFRSIQKDPSSVLPELLENTVADDIVQDQISAAHPYGAFILPRLADAAGIYHTNPKLYYLPDTPALGQYRDTYGGMLVMLEEDADEDWSDYADFGYTENAVSTESVIEDLFDDNDNEVDQRNVLRNRLFDMWVGDWDRHEGQWRWAELDKEDEKGNIYKPIPEDRDNVFFKFDGFIPWFASRKWALRKFQTFDEDIPDLEGLNFNARDFDRRFLTELTRQDWLAVADTLQRRLTDEAIAEAVRLWPDTIYRITGDDIVRKLRSRRSKLKKFAEIYYSFLAEEVNIHGSDKHEYFHVERLDDDRTRVIVYKSDDEGEKGKVLYDRTFYNDETEEIRLYGFGDRDHFLVEGEVNESVLVRIIGGEGEDVIIDKSRVTGFANKTKVYDLIVDTELTESRETSNLLSESLDVNRYKFNQYQYNLLAPQVFLGYNVDDGLFIGGGLLLKTHGFRSEEFKTRQKLIGNYAVNTGAYNFIYEGTFRNLFKSFDLDIDLQTRAPNFISNFYGFGNETTREIEDADFYRYRRDEVIFDPGFQMRFGGNNVIKFGPSFRYNNVYNSSDNFIALPEANISPEAFEKTYFGGIRFEATLNSVDDKFYPENGILWNTSTSWYHGLYEEERSFSTLQSDVSLYLTPRNLPVTLALRFGGASNIGDFYFFQANTLGGNAGFNTQGNLRGYRRDRFSGNSVVYQNTEIRVQLADFRLYVLPVQIGALAFIDHGRVWVDGEESDKIHRGYGGGLFIRPIGKFVLAGTYAISEEDNIFTATLGFLF